MMLTKALAGLTTALLLTALPVTVQATELTVFHGWSSGPEVGALNVLKTDFEAKGHTWTFPTTRAPTLP